MSAVRLNALEVLPKLGEILSLGTQLLMKRWPFADTEAALPPLKIHVMGTATTDMLARAVALATVQEKRRPEITQSLYGSFIPDVLTPDSPLYQNKPEIVLIVSDWRSLLLDLPPQTTEEEMTASMDMKAAEILSMWKKISKGTGAKIIHHFPAVPNFRLMGMAEKYLPASYSSQLAYLLKKLWLSENFGVQMLDLGQFALEHGTFKSFSDRSWHSAKLPIETVFLPFYVPLFRSALRGALNKAKKVLVLDLDNTLWGGVIGDDGVDGIKLGQGDAVSEAYAGFQHYIKLLASRGVILAVCSKNDPEIAKLGFEKEGAVLKLSDFAAFECSWGDKATGLRKIADRLNVGLDSFVFADDNPAECGLIRQELPEVGVVNLTGDPSDFIEQVERGYWFEMQKYSGEDFARSSAYGIRAAALEAQEQASDLSAYLSSLEMVSKIASPSEGQIPRVIQLGQKTNQFNLTTSRFDEARIRKFWKDRDNIVLAATLRDKFGDHGLVSVLVAEKKEDNLEIIEWTMSCRVFSRSFEAFIMNKLAALAKERQIKKLIGRYVPTEKNAVVADLYERLGFSNSGDGEWVLPLESNVSLETFITEV